jgi:hypothetical protein
VRRGKSQSDKFPIQNDLKQEEALPRLLFNFFIIKTVQENQEWLKIKVKQHILAYAADINIMAENLDFI